MQCWYSPHGYVVSIVFQKFHILCKDDHSYIYTFSTHRFYYVFFYSYIFYILYEYDSYVIYVVELHLFRKCHQQSNHWSNEVFLFFVCGDFV